MEFEIHVAQEKIETIVKACGDFLLNELGKGFITGKTVVSVHPIEVRMLEGAGDISNDILVKVIPNSEEKDFDREKMALRIKVLIAATRELPRATVEVNFLPPVEVYVNGDKIHE